MSGIRRMGWDIIKSGEEAKHRYILIHSLLKYWSSSNQFAAFMALWKECGL